jgi:hypothetical protein
MFGGDGGVETEDEWKGGVGHRLWVIGHEFVDPLDLGDA